MVMTDCEIPQTFPDIRDCATQPSFSLLQEEANQQEVAPADRELNKSSRTPATQNTEAVVPLVSHLREQKPQVNHVIHLLFSDNLI